MSIKDLKKRFVYYILISFMVIWTLLIFYNVRDRREEMNRNIINLATQTANITYLKDSLYRQWVARNGGVYVPVSKLTPPNPFLNHLPDRDVTTTGGKHLTLINPAYMTRQVYEMADGKVIQGHLTSNILTNPINKPDAWQKKALQHVLHGQTYSEISQIKGKPYLRFMRPFTTEKACLKCHRFQGYKVGDVRGGISVDVPLLPYYKNFDISSRKESTLSFVIWLFGMMFMLSLLYLIRKTFNKDEEMNHLLQQKVKEEVTVRRKQEEIIFEQKKLSDLSMIINAIAHQWRQPLNVLGLRSQYVAEIFKEGELTQEIIDHFEADQVDTVQNLSSIIDDFRTFFKPDTKETEFEVIKEVLGLLKLIEIQLNSKRIKLSISCRCRHKSVGGCSAGEFPECEYQETLVKGYKGEFKQVIANLIYNSIYAIEEQRTKETNLEGIVSIIINKENKHISISVEDNGGGIPKDVKPHIFNPYFTTKDEGKGTGLGLYLAKLIIQTHMHGKITAHNTSQGASFEIVLPSISQPE